MSRSFDLQGHRGARGLFPENTLAGFTATMAIGVDAIELDIAVTVDGVPVVTHDPVLNRDITRGPDGAWLEKPGPAIVTLTAAELAGYDVGRLRPASPYAARYPDQIPQDGTGIPSLADTFAATTGVRIDAEIKTLPDQPDITVAPEAMADIVLAVATEAGALHRLNIRSFDWRSLRHLRASRPDIPLTWLTSATTAANPALWWDQPKPRSVAQSVARAAAAGPAISWRPVWAPEHPDLTRSALAEAHSLGLAVVAWTVNDPADMARLISWGVDGICTDRPDLARTAMAAAGLALPRQILRG